ncbi:MAG: GntR family transcriptional regulator [Chloroflexi bacterium]|nr:GntR family transcriptional regulator [Chloroflexota bacterium]
MKQRRYETKVDFVVQVLREAIARGELQPGQRLRLEDLASEIGTSLTPVREAMARLASEGLLTYVPHKGVTVAELSPHDVEDIYLARQAIESLVGRLAVIRTERQEDRSALLDSLRGLQQRMQECIRKERPEDVQPLNYEFHMTLYGAARSRPFLETIEKLWSSLPTDSLGAIPGRARTFVEDHEGILKAIEDQDAERTELLLKQHIAMASSSLVTYLLERAERGEGSSRERDK